MSSPRPSSLSERTSRTGSTSSRTRCHPLLSHSPQAARRVFPPHGSLSRPWYSLSHSCSCSYGGSGGGNGLFVPEYTASTCVRVRLYQLRARRVADVYAADISSFVHRSVPRRLQQVTETTYDITPYVVDLSSPPAAQKPALAVQPTWWRASGRSARTPPRIDDTSSSETVRQCAVQEMQETTEVSTVYWS